MQLTLDKGKIGAQYYIRSVQNEVVASKLMAMGIRVDEAISILRKTWPGRAICIKTGGVVMALRKSEASVILVESMHI